MKNYKTTTMTMKMMKMMLTMMMTMMMTALTMNGDGKNDVGDRKEELSNRLSSYSRYRVICYLCTSTWYGIYFIMHYSNYFKLQPIEEILNLQPKMIVYL